MVRSARGRHRLCECLLVAAAALVGLGGCRSDEGDDGRVTAGPDLAGTRVTVGSFGTDQSEVLAELYAQAFEAQGATVERRADLSDRGEAFELLRSGQVTLVPELSGALLAELDGSTEGSARSTAEQLEALNGVLPDGLTVLTPSGAHDSDAIACSRSFVDEYDLVKRSDLEAVPAEEANRECRDVKALDPAIERDDLIVLDDDQLLEPVQAVAPLVRTVDATPAFQATADAVSSTLDSETVRTLVSAVADDGQAAAEVAADWLDEVRLLDRR